MNLVLVKILQTTGFYSPNVINFTKSVKAAHVKKVVFFYLALFAADIFQVMLQMKLIED